MSKNTPFAALIQFILVILMLVSIILLGQSLNMRFYQIGLVIMIITSLSQVAFGNIAPESNFARSSRQYLLFMSIIAVIFAISILLTPTLVALGR